MCLFLFILSHLWCFFLPLHTFFMIFYVILLNYSKRTPGWISQQQNQIYQKVKSFAGGGMREDWMEQTVNEKREKRLVSWLPGLLVTWPNKTYSMALLGITWAAGDERAKIQKTWEKIMPWDTSVPIRQSAASSHHSAWSLFVFGSGCDHHSRTKIFDPKQCKSPFVPALELLTFQSSYHRYGQS